MLARNGVWGVRLDAVAYFAKSIGSGIRHNPGVFEVAEDIAKRVEVRGMRVFAQLDCDNDGCRYFARESQSHYVVNDFTYTSCLSLAILSGDPLPLARHLAKTATMPHICLRSPRTHDGLLLRSGLIEPTVRSRLIALLTEHGLALRTNREGPYEFNCSAPYLYTLSGGRELVAEWIQLAVAVTGMTSGWTYLYLPFLLGHIPEDWSTAAIIGDPRDLNRMQVPSSVALDYLNSGRAGELRKLMSLLAELHGDPDRTLTATASPSLVSVTDIHALSLVAPDRRHHLLANFSNQRTVTIPASIKGDLVLSNRCSKSVLEPAGYGIWRT